MTELETQIWNTIHNWCDAQTNEIPDQNRRYLMDEMKALVLSDVSNCPDLTHLWNNASIKANKNEISIHAMNKVWGALRELERQGFCKLADSTYD